MSKMSNIRTEIWRELMKFDMRLGRIARGILKGIDDEAVDMESLIRGHIAEIDPSAPSREGDRRNRLVKLLALLRNDVKKHGTKAQRITDRETLAFYTYSATHAYQLINNKLGTEFKMVKFNDPSKRILIEGRFPDQWWNGLRRSTVEKLEAQMRLGIRNRETIDDLIKRIGPIVDFNKRNLETLVRTQTLAYNNQARYDTYQALEVVTGVEWISTLDGRTCQICIALDQRKWKKDGTPIGHSTNYQTPPAHHRCRCTTIPIMDSPVLDNETRASAKGPITGDTSFKTFLNTLSDKELKKMGVPFKTLKAFQSGKISQSDLLDRAGKPLPVKALGVD